MNVSPDTGFLSPRAGITARRSRNIPNGICTFLSMIIYPDRRYEETAFLFGNTVGVSPKAPFTVQGGFFIPL